MRISLSRIMAAITFAVCANAAAAESGPALYPHAEINN